MSYVKSSETETWGPYEYLDRHLAGRFNILEEFAWNVAFPVKGLGDVKIIDAHLGYSFEDEYNQVWMVFEIDGALYKVQGWKTSYGTSDWESTFTEVKKKEKVTYDYV